MATENNVETKQTIVEADATTIPDAPKKNAVPAETSPLKNEAEDLGAAVTSSTDTLPDATKKSKKVSDAVNAKAADVDVSKKPDTEAGVTKAATPGQTLKVEEQEKEEEMDLSDDVKALIGDEKLTEEFKTRAATIFEAAVKSKINEAKKKIQTSYEEKLKEEVNSTKAELVEKVDSYLNYVVEEWMKQNELAVERGIKGEIAEDFISGLKKLFEDHYINVPDEKYDVLEDQASKIETLEKKLNEQIESNVKLNSEIGKLTRQDIVDAVSAGLTDTNKEKFNKLAEEIEYSNAEEFKKKVTTIKESYFNTKKEISSNSEIDNVAEGETTNVDLSNAMTAYAAAISKTKDSIKLGSKK
jgi:hypothetical protein